MRTPRGRVRRRATLALGLAAISVVAAAAWRDETGNADAQDAQCVSVQEWSEAFGPVARRTGTFEVAGFTFEGDLQPFQLNEGTGLFVSEAGFGVLLPETAEEAALSFRSFGGSGMILTPLDEDFEPGEGFDTFETGDFTEGVPGPGLSGVLLQNISGEYVLYEVCYARQEEALPDLVVTDASTRTDGDALVAVVAVANIGDAPSPATIVELRAEELEPTRLDIGPLEPGTDTGLLEAFIGDAGDLPETFELELEVDPDGEIPEIDEDNNALAIQVAGPPGGDGAPWGWIAVAAVAGAAGGLGACGTERLVRRRRQRRWQREALDEPRPEKPQKEGESRVGKVDCTTTLTIPKPARFEVRLEGERCTVADETLKLLERARSADGRQATRFEKELASRLIAETKQCGEGMVPGTRTVVLVWAAGKTECVYTKHAGVNVGGVLVWTLKATWKGTAPHELRDEIAEFKSGDLETRPDDVEAAILDGLRRVGAL